MKIGLILHKFLVGGAERVVLELACQYGELGHHAVIASLSHGGGMLETFERSGIPLRQLGAARQRRRSPRWFIDVIKARRLIADFFARERFDVIHTHLMGPDIECVFPARRVNPKVLVHTIHNTYTQFGSRRPFDVVENWRRRRAYARYDRVVAVHDEVKNWAIKKHMVAPGHILTVHNGIDFSRLDVPQSREQIRKGFGWSSSDSILLNVASLTEQKNQLNLIRAVDLVLHGGFDLRLVIAGTGPLQDRLAKEIRVLKLQGKVELLGYRKDVPALLKGADMFVLSSFWEGLPICVLEALAAGIPVLVSDVPVHRRILESGRLGGLLASTSPEGIAESIVRILGDGKLVREKSTLATVKIREEYSARKMATGYLSVYEQIAEQKGVGR